MAGFLSAKKEATRFLVIPSKNGIVVVPDHGANQDLAPGTENSILKQAGIKKDCSLFSNFIV